MVVRFFSSVFFLSELSPLSYIVDIHYIVFAICFGPSMGLFFCTLGTRPKFFVDLVGGMQD